MKEMDEKISSDDYNLEETCRTCACNYKSEELIPLYLTRNGEKPIDLVEKFQTNDFQICIYDNLPTNICTTCYRNFKILYYFITQCEGSEKFLKNYFQPTEILDNNLLDSSSNNEFEENCVNTLKIETISNSDYFNIDSSPIDYTVETEDHLEDENLDMVENQQIFNDETISISNVKDTPLNNNDDNTNNSFSNSENSEKNCYIEERNLGKIICKICNFSIYKRNYTSHMKKHRPVILKGCEICDAIVEDIELHNKIEHKIFVCNICKISFSTARKQRAHIFKIHDRTGYNCNICGRAFLYPNILKRHLEYVHSKNTPKAVCDICGKLLKNESVLLNHRALHFKNRKTANNDNRSKQIRSDINSFKCPFCSLKFRNLFGLKNHSKFHRKDKNSENYKHVCKFCNQRFKRSDHLELHIDLVHLKNLPFTCPYCQKRFPKQYVLNQHVRKIHTEGPRECQYCNKPYLSRSSLNRHIKLHHLNEQNFKCDICLEVFSTVHKYQTHMKIHTVEEEKETAQRIYDEILHNNT